MTLLAGIVLAAVPAAEVEITYEAPETYVVGDRFPVEVVVRNPGSEPAAVEARLLGPGAFAVDGEPLSAGGGAAEVAVPAGGRLTAEFDLAPHLDVDGPFRLGLVDGEAREVGTFAPAEEGADFMSMGPEELQRYRVLMETNRGTMLFDLWPEDALEHVRNFLDLASSGFYDGTLFHRVSDRFMIQGGDPNTREYPEQPQLWGSGAGPRRVPHEGNTRKHVEGVLSAARTDDPDSHSSQFFVMTANAPHLDHDPSRPKPGYSAFGKLVKGYDALRAIARAPGELNPRDGTVRPEAPQRIERAIVLIPLGKEGS